MDCDCNDCNSVYIISSGEGVVLMMANKSLFTSFRQDWKTPKATYEKLNKEFNFDFDPCPNNPDFDGLKCSWGGANFVNPPYKTKIQDAFVDKGIEEWKKGKTIVFLLPARTSTKRFHRLLGVRAEFRFIEGRLCFDDTGMPAPFPSMIVILRGKKCTLANS